MLDRPLAKATPAQLVDCDHAVLLSGDLGDLQAGSGDFYPHEGA
jgi:hypothetical protein